MRVYYQPTGGISAIPEVIDLVVLKVFGCVTPQDYEGGSIRFSRTPAAPGIFVREIEEFQPDVVVIESLSPKMLVALSKVRRVYSGPIVAFWGDLANRNSLSVLKQCGRYLDLLLVVDKRSEATLQHLGIPAKYTIQPAMSSVYKYEPGAEKLHDIVFAGSIPISRWQFRKSDLSERLELARAFADWPRFGLYGNDSWRTYGLPVRGWVNEYELAGIFNRSKIVLSADQYLHVPGFTSVRTNKALCCGAFLLIRRFEGIEDMFVNRKHVVWFHSVEEAVSLAEYYVSHDDERQRIAMAGMEWALKNAQLRDLFQQWLTTKPARTYSVGIGDEVQARIWGVVYFLQRASIRLAGDLGLLPAGWLHWPNEA